jgi:UDP-N-acetylmuramoylalanine--D-glutamate ligase
MNKTQTYNQKLAAMTEQMIHSRKQNLKKSFRLFTGAEHRMETIRQKNGVNFINDSKAENVNATYFALQSIRKPVIWIAGGDDFRVDYWELMALVRKKVEAIIMIGSENERLFHIFSPVINNMYEVNNMEEAVRLANQIGEEGTTVLLSPACKPDLRFADYQDRGNKFKEAVMKNI